MCTLPEALKDIEQTRNDFAVTTALPPGDFKKLIATAHGARAAIVIYGLLRLEGNQRTRIQDEIKALRVEVTSEKAALSAPMIKKIMDVLWDC